MGCENGFFGHVKFSDKPMPRAEPDVATQVAQHGASMTVIDWARLLRLPNAGSETANFVATGERR